MKNLIEHLKINLENNNKVIYLSIFIPLIIIYLVQSFYKYPLKDEALYLLETANMADILSNWQWFGNDAVGWHGFLFKVPAALIFLITGPSVLAAIYYNYFLALLCVYLFYKLLKKYFNEDYLITLGIILLVTNSYFVSCSTRFLREIPVLFSFLLFLYLLVNKRSKILIGLSLLLIFDAKEHVFFQLAPGLGLWLIYIHLIKSKNEKILQRIWNFTSTCLIYFSPVLLYLYLMFFTGLVPLNIVNAYILGLIEKGLTPVLQQYEYGALAFIEFENWSKMLFVKCFGMKAVNNYFVKFFMPSMFSFLTIPMVILIPAFYMSFSNLFDKNSELRKDSKIYFFLLWSFFFTFYIMMGFGRYFFPAIPLIILYFIQFIKGLKLDRRNITIMSFSSFMIAFSFLFEYKSLIVKILINIIIIACFVLISYNNEKRIFSRKFIYLFFGILFGIFPLFNVVVANFNSGQMRDAINFGYCGELYKVTDKISDGSRAWVNLISSEFGVIDKTDIGLFKFYRKERMENPGGSFRLKSWIPKRQMLKHYPDKKTVFFPFEGMTQFRDKLFKEQINNVCFFYSEIEQKKFYKQDEIEMLKKQKFLYLKNVVKLKNRRVFIFDVVGDY